MALDTNVNLIPKRFPIQSYFDATLLETAIVPQPVGQPIVPSTLETVQSPGMSIGLHPASETPVAVKFRFDTKNVKTTSGVVILTPGMVITPRDVPFSGFQWGLPQGWLGGGTALLQVFPTAQGYASGRKKEVIFHCQRYTIVAEGALPTHVPNWPIAFPWKNADSGNSQQRAEDVITVEPTRLMLRLRKPSPGLLAPATMRLVLRGNISFDHTSAGLVSANVDPSYQDVDWPVQGGHAHNCYPTIELAQGIAKLGGPDAGIVLSDLGDAALTGVDVDLIRYGNI